MKDIKIHFRPPTVWERLSIEWGNLKRRMWRAWRLATVQGVPGVSYFDPMYDWNVRKVYLNGVDVTNRASECDTSAGWVMLYDVETDGKTPCSSTRPRKQFGKVRVER